MSYGVLLDLVLSILLGGMIGFERQWNQGMAGLRTNTLVAFSSACFVTIGAHFGDDRIAAQIVSGIGFLGAGVILHEGPTVRGLNTAATLWCAAAVGALSGSGLRVEATYAGVGVVLLNIGLRHIQIIINRRRTAHPVDVEAGYAIEIVCHADAEEAVRRQLSRSRSDAGLELRTLREERFQIGDGPAGSGLRIAAEFNSHARVDAAVSEIVGQIGRESGVTSAHWSVSMHGSAAPRGSALAR